MENENQKKYIIYLIENPIDLKSIQFFIKQTITTQLNAIQIKNHQDLKNLLKNNQNILLNTKIIIADLSFANPEHNNINNIIELKTTLEKLKISTERIYAISSYEQLKQLAQKNKIFCSESKEIYQGFQERKKYWN